MNRFGPFSFYNYRLYYSGQALSLVGTWMQQIALAWLVLSLTHSGTILGLVIATQTLPVLLLASYGGLIADRMSKRRLLLITQSCLGLVSLTTALLISNHLISILPVFLLSALIGISNAFATPTRQSFISELVPTSQLRAAVSLNSVMVNVARAVGPATAGILIASVGTALCFYCDAISYLFVLAALLLLKTTELSTPAPTARAKGQLRDGLRYVKATPHLLTPLLMMALIGTFAYEFPVLMPLLATSTFHGTATTLGLFVSVQAAGAILGGLYVTKAGVVGIGATARGAALFCITLLLAAVAPNRLTELIILPFMGFSSIVFLSTGASTIQLSADPAYRGRVMALWAMAFLGSTPIGGPIIGAISEHLSPRYGLLVGALSCFVALVLGFRALQRLGVSPTRRIIHPQTPPHLIPPTD